MTFALCAVSIVVVVVRAGVIFAVAEDQQGPPPVLISELFGYRVEDGIVKRCAQVARLFRAELQEMPAIVLVAIQAVQIWALDWVKSLTRRRWFPKHSMKARSFGPRTS